MRLDGADAATSISQVVADTMNLVGGEPMLLERLAGADAVLVLDNCERVVDAVAN